MKKIMGTMAIVLAMMLVGVLAGVALAAAGVIPSSESGSSGTDAAVDLPASYRSEEAAQSGSTTLPPDENPSAASKSSSAPYALSSTLSYYYVAGATLYGRGSSVEYAYSGFGCIYATTGTNAKLITELHLPTGSMIKYLRLDYVDSSTTGNVTAYLTKYKPGQDFTDVMAVTSAVPFSGGNGYVVSLELSEIIDNENYAYTLMGMPSTASNSLQVCGLRVAYYAPLGPVSYLPSISK